jgi:hypothetical protein
MKIFLLAIAAFCILSIAPKAECQWKQPPSTGSPENHLPDRTKLAGQSGMGPLLTAKLLDKEANAKKHRAVVEVKTDGVKLVDAALAQNEPKLDEAHIQYSLDDGPPQNTTSTTWSFQGLSRGEHRIRVNLVASDGQKVGEGTTLKVEVP